MTDVPAELTRSLWTYMAKEFGAKVVDKRSSILMRAVAIVLAILGVVEKEEFMCGYATTIGRTIYVPFEVGGDNDRWSLWQQMVVCVHECQHIAQLNHLGWLFLLRYLLKPSYRAVFEAEAYCCKRDLVFWRTGKVVGASELARSLHGYALSEDEIERATHTTTDEFRITNEASLTAIAWLENNAPNIREQ